MTTVDKDTANWRLYGGGGLLVGGLLWLVGVILSGVAGMPDVGRWVTVIGVVVVAIGLFLVAWGQTGSNGAVGNNMMGKVGLWAAAIGFLAWGLLPVFEVGGDWLGWLVLVLVGLGSLIAAVIIMQKGVARGLAKWMMFAVAIVAIVYFLGAFGVLAMGGDVMMVLAYLFPVVVALTGIVYVLNKK
ncbi:MAG TPA: hypothetical protein PK781_09005 [Terrimesophilobacter sp.]|nr:hypothetical protein [Terrimesophilobacter sp.]HRQ00585.1 hypothetical protein [Terrimesophilobacter sp.]